jgi:hypothetical protein
MKGVAMPSECERTRLIGEIATLLAVERMPDDTRTAALTLIGWLARRMPGECAHALGVDEARAAGVGPSGACSDRPAPRSRRAG